MHACLLHDTLIYTHTTGIGKSLALEYASSGAGNIIIAARNVANLEQVKQEIGLLYKHVGVHVVRGSSSSSSSSIVCVFLLWSLLLSAMSPFTLYTTTNTTTTS